MLDLFFIFLIFSALFLRTESCSQNAEDIAADKMNIMEWDPESTSVTI